MTDPQQLFLTATTTPLSAHSINYSQVQASDCEDYAGCGQQDAQR